MESPLKYKKTTGFATTEGQQLEVNLAALLFLRALNSGLEFQLGTNVAGAGALDDVVFRFKPSRAVETWTTLYIQLKYKANRPVQRTMLTSPKGDFSLPKYFESYCEIKQAVSKAEQGTLLDGSFEESVFVIYTNAKASGPLGKECNEALSRAEEFVWCGKGNVLSFEEDEDMLECLDKCGDEGKTFLGRLRVFCSQPNANRLETAIENELRKVDEKNIRGVDLKSLLDEFLRRMKVWWEKSSEVLHEGNDLLRASILEITSQQTEKKYMLDVDFEEVVLDRLRVSVAGNGRVVNVQSSESSCRLSLTKLCQAFGGQSLVLDSEGLLANKGALLAQWRKGDAKSLIICTDGWSSSQQVECFNVVKDLLAISNAPPIVFLSKEESTAVEALTGEFGETERCQDDFLFSHLKTKSREKVLSTEVSLQGHSTTLRELLNDTPGGADRVLDACSVVEVLDRDGSLTLGSAFGEAIGFYVDRRLEQATVVRDTVFQDGALRGNVTVRVMQCQVSDSCRLVKDNVREPFGLRRVAATSYEDGLFEKAIGFLSSLQGSRSFHHVSSKEIVSNLSKLVADKDNHAVFIGPEFALGSFECSSVGLRFGQQDAVTALRVRTSKHSPSAGFLFVSDKTSENDARTLSDFHQSKHWLALRDGQLRWTRSHGDIETIRPHIDEDQVSTYAPENVIDVEDRLVLVCAEPGMGKSTLLARLARNTKEAHPRWFVFLVALSDHSQLFAQDKHKDVLGFLCSANKIESHLHRSLLKYALEVSGDVVVLLDGFDEIAPKYVEQSCDLLENLVDHTNAKKIWMTSRNSIRSTLEARISKFAVKLRKFSEEDQTNFLKKFWAEKSSSGELDEFIVQLVEKMSLAVRDKEKNFLAIPLQTRMLAEVYEDHVAGSTGMPKLPDKLDLLVLLEQFLDKKCGVYVQAKLKISTDSPNYEALFKSSRKSFINSHARAALVLILGRDIMKTLHMDSILKKASRFLEEIQNGSYKTGFIDSIVNDKPHFIHRVFAEYFVAKWIAKHFAEYRELVESKLFTADFTVIRNVFDRILTKDCVLHTAVINEDLEEVRTLLESEDVDVDAKDGGGRTALHLAASLGTSKDREENKRRGEILDLLIGKTSDFDRVDDVLCASPLKYADVTRTWVAVDKFQPRADNKKQFALTLDDVISRDMLDAVFSLDLHNLVGFCLDNGLEVEHCTEGENRLLYRACELGSLKVASILIERNANIYRYEDRNDFILHRASSNGHAEIVKLLHKHHIATLRDIAVEELSTWQMMQLGNYINMADKYGTTAIHLAARNGHSDIVSFLISQGGNPNSKDGNNMTPLHMAAVLKHPNAVRVLLEALAETDQASAANARNNTGTTVLNYGVLGGCVDCVALLVQAGGKLTLTSDDGDTPLITAAYKGHQEVTRYLLNNFDAEREAMSRLDYVNSANNVGRTAIHLAAAFGHSHVIGFLVSEGGDSQSRDLNNNTPLHLAAASKKPGAVRALLGTLDEANRPGAVDSRDTNGNSALMYAALEGCVECLDLLLKAGGKLSQAGDECSPLMVAAKKGHLKIVSYMLNNFDTEREAMSQHDFINLTLENGSTAVHLATLNGHAEVVSFLLSEGGDPRRGDNDGVTPLHLAAGFKHPAAVSALLEALHEADRAKACNAVDINGFSVLMHGALAGCAECVRLVAQAGATQASYDRITPLMMAAHEGHQKVASFLIDNFDADSEGMNRLDYVNKTDNAGRTAIHLAAQNGCSEVIGILVCRGSDIRSRDRDGVTPLHLAAGWKQPAAVRALLEALAEANRASAVNAVDDDGNSALMYGAYGGCVECVGILVCAGGKLTQTSGDGRTTLMAAAERHHEAVLAYLLSAFDSEKEGMSKLAYVTMLDSEGNLAQDFALAGCRHLLESLLLELVS